MLRKEQEPMVCPGCKSPYWNTPPRKKTYFCLLEDGYGKKIIIKNQPEYDQMVKKYPFWIQLVPPCNDIITVQKESGETFKIPALSIKPQEYYSVDIKLVKGRRDKVKTIWI